MILRRTPSLGAIVLLVLLVIALVGGDDPEPASDGGAPAGESPGGEGASGVAVLDVVDGDTIRVEYEGREESVRLIGIDTPEVDPSIGVECFGADASHFTEELLEGERVRLVFDAELRDAYDRLLAYVYLEPGERFVNAEIVSHGLARTLEIAPNDRFASLFDRLQQAAANAGRGLWGAC